MTGDETNGAELSKVRIDVQRL